MVDANKKKSKTGNIKQNTKLLREKIVESMVASFRIEGIIISPEKAAATLKKLELIGQK
jgi:hypothetical protein